MRISHIVNYSGMWPLLGYLPTKNYIFEIISSKYLNFVYPQSGIGIMVEGCESVEDYSEGTEDFIELPAITKPRTSVDNTNTSDNSPSKSSPPQSGGNARSQSINAASKKFSRDYPQQTTSYVLNFMF